VHGHGDADRLALGEAQEVDVDGEVLHRVELVVARDGAGPAAVDVDVEHRRQEVAGEDQLPCLVEVDRDRLRRFAAAVDHGWYLALAPNGPGGPLAGPVARHGLELLDITHGCGPLMVLQKPRAALRRPRAVVRPCLQGCRAGAGGL
jgi:hypothetical protein